MKFYLSAVLYVCCSWAMCAAAAEQPVSFTAEQVAQVVAKAPAAPIHKQLEEEGDLKLKLVDFIDFTDPNDIHDMRDRGTSRIIDSPLGKYRETAAHRHAMVSVRWRADAQDKPHVLVWEYPDDQHRQICFFTHESRLRGKQNLDWSLETGVNCGHPLPLSKKMQYHTFFFWPTDKFPVAMYMNWARNDSRAAASRLWVYRVQGDKLPPLQVSEPDDENPRIFGGLHNWSLVPTKGIFGFNRETVFDHIAEYHAYRGDNIISWPVVSNNSWGFRCQIPAWDGGTKPIHGADLHELEKVLAACEKHNIKFLPIFNVGTKFKMGGKTNADTDPAERRALLEKGFKQFIDRYGASKAIYGIAFETQDLSPKYGECSLDEFRKSFGSIKKFKDYMQTIAPDLELFHFLGGKNIHSQYFYDGAGVFDRWEKGSQTWSAHLANEINDYWVENKRDPKELADDGVHTILTYQSDDYHIFDTYYQNPRAMTYWDTESSPERAGLFDTRKAMVWNTFYEGYIGLSPKNWWYLKVWVAPDFNPAGPLALSGWTQAMQHRDRDLLMFGAWNNKGAGHELKLRRMAKAFRSLPPTELKDETVKGDSPVRVRSATYKGKLYVNCINHTPFSQTLHVCGAALTLAPYAMETVIKKSGTKVAARGSVNKDYVKWLDQRLDDYQKDMHDVKRLQADAVPAAYERHAERAQHLFKQADYQTMDMALGHGVPYELGLRKRILAPPQLKIPKASGAISADLHAWPQQAADWQTGGEHIAAHLFFPAFWGGAKDLSIRMRAFHDDTHLHIGMHVKDQVLTAKDACAIYFSGDNYRLFTDNKQKYEASIPVPIPKSKEPQALKGAFQSQGQYWRVADGYMATISIPKEHMPLKDNTIGFVVNVADDDATKFLNKAGWARKQALLFPHSPTFAYYQDARTCIQMKLE